MSLSSYVLVLAMTRRDHSDKTRNVDCACAELHVLPVQVLRCCGCSVRRQPYNFLESDLAQHEELGL